jgi:hypothetical protein
MNIQTGTGWKFKRKITKNLSLIHGITTLIVSSKLSDSGSGETIDHPEDPSSFDDGSCSSILEASALFFIPIKAGWL